MLNTCCRESELNTGNLSITDRPHVVTNSAPYFVQAVLKSALEEISTTVISRVTQTNVSITTHTYVCSIVSCKYFTINAYMAAIGRSNDTLSTKSNHSCLALYLTSLLVLLSGTQVTPASSEWAQLWLGLKGQSKRESSIPVHMRSSRWISPTPAPKKARL